MCKKLGYLIVYANNQEHWTIDAMEGAGSRVCKHHTMSVYSLRTKKFNLYSDEDMMPFYRPLGLGLNYSFP